MRRSRRLGRSCELLFSYIEIFCFVLCVRCDADGFFLGRVRFKILKSLGVKGAPKITIALLDQEDLRATAHLMNSYPAVLKEKALALGK